MKGQSRKRFVLNQKRIVSFMAVLEQGRKWRMVVGAEGVGLMRCGHLTHKERVFAAFGKLKSNMQTLCLRHFIVLDISWIYPRQSLICTGGQSVLCQKLLTTLFRSKAHFVAIPGDSTS